MHNNKTFNIYIISFSILFLFSYQIKANNINVCSAYTDKNIELGCNSNNYLIQFGYKYCQAFLNYENHFSKSGQIILNNIRNCLIQKLNSENNLNCSNIKQEAQQMHIQCYFEFHFCDLNFWDKEKIFWIVKKEVLDPMFFKTFITVNKSCRNFDSVDN